MKVNLSDRAAERVLALYEASGMDCKLTHFLNLLIQQIPLPNTEDTKHDRKEKSL